MSGTIQSGSTGKSPAQILASAEAAAGALVVTNPPAFGYSSGGPIVGGIPTGGHVFRVGVSPAVALTQYIFSR